MNKLAATLLLGLIVVTNDGLGQKNPARYFGSPILTDSLSTLFIPIMYNDAFLSANKIAFWGGYYANIVAYNYKADTYKKIFPKDTYIAYFGQDSYRHHLEQSSGRKTNLTKNWVFLLVKTKDTNSSGRIDEKDPSVLFAVSKDGQILRQLTEETENVVSFEIYEEMGFILLKIQRDSDNDRSFKNEDVDFYYRNVNLSDLSFGKPVEI